jgi:hypothetical protein
VHAAAYEAASEPRVPPKVTRLVVGSIYAASAVVFILSFLHAYEKSTEELLVTHEPLPPPYECEPWGWTTYQGSLGPPSYGILSVSGLAPDDCRRALHQADPCRIALHPSSVCDEMGPSPGVAWRLYGLNSAGGEDGAGETGEEGTGGDGEAGTLQAYYGCEALRLPDEDYRPGVGHVGQHGPRGGESHQRRGGRRPGGVVPRGL